MLRLIYLWQLALMLTLVVIHHSAQSQTRSLNIPDQSGYDGKAAGEVVDLWRGVTVIANGEDYLVSHGRHYHSGGYYYGQKWQCVEYAKRYYKDALNHEMPDVMGHAADFFDPDIPQGQLNPARHLIQYYNGGNEPPQPDDLMVWAYDRYGHIAVVTRVTDREVEVIQQNVTRGSRMTLPLEAQDGSFRVGDGPRSPVGWLRLMQ